MVIIWLKIINFICIQRMPGWNSLNLTPVLQFVFCSKYSSLKFLELFRCFLFYFFLLFLLFIKYNGLQNLSLSDTHSQLFHFLFWVDMYVIQYLIHRILFFRKLLFWIVKRNSLVSSKSFFLFKLYKSWIELQTKWNTS